MHERLRDHRERIRVSPLLSPLVRARTSASVEASDRETRANAPMRFYDAPAPWDSLAASESQIAISGNLEGCAR